MEGAIRISDMKDVLKNGKKLYNSVPSKLCPAIPINTTRYNIMAINNAIRDKKMNLARFFPSENLEYVGRPTTKPITPKTIFTPPNAMICPEKSRSELIEPKKPTINPANGPQKAATTVIMIMGKSI
jgi:hypothetical protein